MLTITFDIVFYFPYLNMKWTQIFIFDNILEMLYLNLMFEF